MLIALGYLMTFGATGIRAGTAAQGGEQGADLVTHPGYQSGAALKYSL